MSLAERITSPWKPFARPRALNPRGEWIDPRLYSSMPGRYVGTLSGASLSGISYLKKSKN